MSKVFSIGLFIILFFSAPLKAQYSNPFSTLTHLGGKTGCSTIYQNKAFVCKGDYLQVLDISGTGFEMTSELDLNGLAKDIVIRNDFAYILIDGLYIVNIADPMNMEIVAKVLFQFDEEPSLYVEDSYAYIAGGNSGVVIIDISDKFNPIILEEFVNGSDLSDISVFNSYAFVIDETNQELLVLDISDHSVPIQVTTVLIDGVNSLFIEDHYLYATTTEWPNLGMQIIDISDPLVPVQLASFETKIVDGHNSHYHQPVKVIVDDQKAYISCRASLYLFIADVTDPENPVELGHFQVEDSAGPVLSTDIDFPYFYTTINPFNKVGSFRKIDISDPANPTQIKVLQSPEIINSVQVDASHMYVASQSALWIYDTFDPSNPEVLSFNEEWGGLFQIYIHDHKLFCLGFNRFYILDISDPSEPVQFGTYEQEDQIRDLYVAADQVFIISGGPPGKLSIINIEDLNNPLKTNDIELAGTGKDIYSDPLSSLTFIAINSDDGNHIVQVYNMSDPENPTMVTSFPSKGDPTSLVVSEDKLYLGSNRVSSPDPQWNLEVFDLTNISAPEKTTELFGPGNINKVLMQEEAILTAISDVSDDQSIWDSQQSKQRNSNLNGSIRLNLWYNDIFYEEAYISLNNPIFFDAYIGHEGIGYGASVNGSAPLGNGQGQQGLRGEARGNRGLDILNAELNVFLKIIKLKPLDLEIPVGQEQQFIAEGFNRNDEFLSGIKYDWSVKEGVGSIDQNGVYSSDEEGEFTIAASFYFKYGIAGGSVYSTTSAQKAFEEGNCLLIQNQPNPFKETTRIDLCLEKEGIIDLNIYDYSGDRIIIVDDKWYPAGNHELIFDGHSLSPGFYLMELLSGSDRRFKKVIVY